MKSGNLNFLEPSGPLQACNVTALPLIVGWPLFSNSGREGATGYLRYLWGLWLVLEFMNLTGDENFSDSGEVCCWCTKVVCQDTTP
jgi:hypothetical protein